jgi:hypothetical protein
LRFQQMASTKKVLRFFCGRAFMLLLLLNNPSQGKQRHYFTYIQTNKL